MVRKLTKYFTYLILAMVFLIAVFAFFMPTTTDFKLAVVYTGSMEPVMPVGSVALMEPVDPSNLEEGDIIAFHPVYDSETIVSHRVVEVLEKDSALEFLTKGDANEDPDIFPVPADNVLARVSFNIPYLGYGLVNARDYVKSRLGFTLLIGLPTLLLVGIAYRDLNLVRNPRLRRMKERKERLRRRKSSSRSRLALLLINSI